MKIYTCKQGSPEWLQLRLGMPTASQFDRIITPKKLEATKGETRRRYQIELLTELILGMPLEKVTTEAMQAGKHYEPKARAAYEALRNVDVVDAYGNPLTESLDAGFCTTDDGTMGYSPDGYVGSDGLIEIKFAFDPTVHVGRLLRPQDLVDEHRIQCLGGMWVTGRSWCDLVSYAPGFPLVVERIFLKNFAETWEPIAERFLLELGEMMRDVRSFCSIGTAKPDPDLLSDEDVEVILAAKAKDAL